VTTPGPVRDRPSHISLRSVENVWFSQPNKTHWPSIIRITFSEIPAELQLLQAVRLVATLSMKSQPPALTPEAIAAAAGKKAVKAKKKLRVAKAELKASNAVLLKHSTDKPQGSTVEVALQHNVAAEGMVQEATKDLDVVEELLSDVETGPAEGSPRSNDDLQHRSGEGVGTVIRHLRRRRQ